MTAGLRDRLRAKPPLGGTMLFAGLGATIAFGLYIALTTDPGPYPLNPIFTAIGVLVLLLIAGAFGAAAGLVNWFLGRFVARHEVRMLAARLLGAAAVGLLFVAIFTAVFQPYIAAALAIVPIVSAVVGVIVPALILGRSPTKGTRV